MVDQKNGKGFSGFDDLVSDISKDLEQPNVVADNQSLNQSPSQGTSSSQISSPSQQAPRPTSMPSSVRLPSGSGWGSGKKWVIGIIITLISIAFWNSGTEKKKERSYVPKQEQISAPAPASTFVPDKPRKVIAPSTAPASPRTDSKLNEIVPPVGTNNILGRDELRYCLSEAIRMSAMKEEVDLYSETEVDRFNATIQDYNCRCGQFRYRKGSLESVRREVEAQKIRLEAEGTLIIKRLRGHSSSVIDEYEKNLRKTNRARK